MSGGNRNGDDQVDFSPPTWRDRKEGSRPSSLPGKWIVDSGQWPEKYLRKRRGTRGNRVEKKGTSK
jgi:hypothetical protein